MSTTKISPRQAALACGATKYQGAPCHKGHLGVRYTCNCHCVDCVYEGIYRRKGRGVV